MKTTLCGIQYCIYITKNITDVFVSDMNTHLINLTLLKINIYRIM